MKEFHAKSVCQGVAVGKIFVYQKGQRQVRREMVQDTDAEIRRYEAAREQAMQELQALYEKALKDVGEVNAAIFEMHRMMLEDDGFRQAAIDMIEQQSISAQYAAARTGERYAGMFADMEDDYMRARAADVKDITQRLLAILCGDRDMGPALDEPAIIVAQDLAPSETILLDKSKVLAFVTVQGSANSHTAILARTMDIPALAGAPIEDLSGLNGLEAIVDGEDGRFFVEPDEQTRKALLQKQEELREKRRLLRQLMGKETVTKDGRSIQLYANIGSHEELELVTANDAAGIGLFRSEFLYLERESAPTEEEQFRIYRTVAEKMGEKQVIIRTLDIGADKQCAYMDLPKEENPAMGMRAIRICLTRPEIFKTQLRALFRAGVYGNLAVMYPMITGVEEIRRIQEVVREVCRELEAEKIAYKMPKQGIMIETPAAVMMSRELAQEVDFFSIGTNDLTQYALAADRQNPALDEFFDARHPAVLRMIELVVQNAHAAGIWVGICGELGADTRLTETFLRMGVDELSVSPGKILPVRQAVRELDLRLE